MKEILGELVGTFILVLLGCGSVAYTLVNPDFTLLQIALCWMLGVFFGILASRNISFAHLNPAVTVAFWARGDVDRRYVKKAILGQFLGAVLAAVTIYLIFQGYIEAFENANGIDRASMNGHKSGFMFGEYYNPKTVSLAEAMAVEGVGTAILVTMIMIYFSKRNYHPLLSPLFTGLTVAILIMFLAPTTQCGINPARDFGPRLVSFAFGWKSAFDIPMFGAFLTFILAPIAGGLLGLVSYNFLKKLT